MKKNIIGKLINNKIVLYVVVAFATLNVLGYFSMRSWECIVLFSATAYSVNCYGKNMTVGLLAGLFVSNFVFGCNRVKENFEEAMRPVGKAQKLLKKAEKKALKEGNDAKEEEEAEGFSTIEGNENMANAVKMLGALGKGKEGLGNAAGIEKMIAKMGGVGKIMQAFGSMNE
tara:strand:+ start:2869 stop:3384 length:516 start_codon:yes stop_codon:yes gene_type:complete